MKQVPMTVVIPTRERCDVLAKALATVTQQDYDDLEIVVCDNASADATAEVTRQANDPRIRYVNPGRRLGMAQNWEFALSHVREQGWVTVLGDDDGLLPGALARASALVGELGVEALRSRVCEYLWPSLIGKPYGRLHVPLTSGHEVRESRKWLQKALDGTASYLQLPVLYNGGFVSTAVLARIRQATGALYRSCAPDVYSAAAIASVVPRYAYLRSPLALNGASRHSTGTSAFTTVGSTTAAERFQAEDPIPYHADVPMCPGNRYPRSPQVSFYEAFLQSATLRSGAPHARHDEQLVTVLSQVRESDREMHAWAETFAQRHGLDLATAGRRARERRRVAALRALPGFAALKLTELRIGSERLPIPDVHTAAQAAQAAILGGPQRLLIAGQVFGRTVRKAATRLASPAT
jgi:hypothetical protein